MLTLWILYSSMPQERNEYYGMLDNLEIRIDGLLTEIGMLSLNKMVLFVLFHDWFFMLKWVSKT